MKDSGVQGRERLMLAQISFALTHWLISLKFFFGLRGFCLQIPCSGSLPAPRFPGFGVEIVDEWRRGASMNTFLEAVGQIVTIR